MLSLLRRRPGAQEPAAVSPVENPSSSAMLHEAIRSISGRASSMGREAAEVRGVIDDTTQSAQRSAQAVSALARRVQEITESQQAIGQVTQDSLGAVDRARDAVEGVGQEVVAIVSTLRQVADAVKDLAGKVEASSKQIMSTVAELNARIESLAAEIRAEPGQAAQGAFHRALGEVQAGVARISTAADGSRAICGDLGERMAGIEREIAGTGAALDVAMKRSESFLRVSEQLIETVSQCGIETEDTPYIQAAQQAAAQISQLLENSLRTGVATMADLFDEAYQPIAGSSPAQHTTRFVGLADRLFPQVQEHALTISPKVVYCIAVDRNGYVATHNQKYCQPQRAGDVVWNTANSRWRRIFNDRTGLASARNERPFLLQTYRRDMGGGNFIIMKEAAAPIVVDGRHWGGLRLAFQF